VPTVSITQTPRSPELKRRLISEITRVIVDVYDVRPEQVSVHFYELDDESWGNAGRLAVDREFSDAADVD
jgi:4-oxalocrotonate tautomerase family enzyme